MKKYFILLACLTLISCKNIQEKECCPENPLVDSAIVASVDTSVVVMQDSAIVKITKSLQKSKNVEQGIQHIIQHTATLEVHNKKLNRELEAVKDSLQKVTYELRETKLKLPRKRSFLQKVLGVARDSVEVIITDTIQTN